VDGALHQQRRLGFRGIMCVDIYANIQQPWDIPDTRLAGCGWQGVAHMTMTCWGCRG